MRLCSVAVAPATPPSTGPVDAGPTMRSSSRCRAPSTLQPSSSSNVADPCTPAVASMRWRPARRPRRGEHDGEPPRRARRVVGHRPAARACGSAQVTVLRCPAARSRASTTGAGWSGGAARARSRRAAAADRSRLQPGAKTHFVFATSRRRSCSAASSSGGRRASPSSARSGRSGSAPGTSDEAARRGQRAQHARAGRRRRQRDLLVDPPRRLAEREGVLAADRAQLAARPPRRRARRAVAHGMSALELVGVAVRVRRRQRRRSGMSAASGSASGRPGRIGGHLEAAGRRIGPRRSSSDAGREARSGPATPPGAPRARSSAGTRSTAGRGSRRQRDARASRRTCTRPTASAGAAWKPGCDSAP